MRVETERAWTERGRQWAERFMDFGERRRRLAMEETWREEEREGGEIKEREAMDEKGIRDLSFSVFFLLRSFSPLSLSKLRWPNNFQFYLLFFII